MNRSDLERFLVVQGWKQPWKTLRQHCFANAGRPGEHEMVSARRRHFDCVAGLRLPDDVGEVGPVVAVVDVDTGANLQRPTALDPILHLPQGTCAAHLDAVDQRRLGEVLDGHDDPRPAVLFGGDHRRHG